MEGAQILCGEGVDRLNLPRRNQAGYFMLPTVITDIKDESCCMKEEIFGPVTCVVPFDSEEEVIQRANSVKYGLAATVWSGNVGRVHRVAKKLQSGLVWTNCWLIRELNLPFGGMKSSGVGREGAKDSYEFFTEIKTITIKHWPWPLEKLLQLTPGCRENQSSSVVNGIPGINFSHVLTQQKVISSLSSVLSIFTLWWRDAISFQWRVEE